MIFSDPCWQPLLSQNYISLAYLLSDLRTAFYSLVIARIIFDYKRIFYIYVIYKHKIKKYKLYNFKISLKKITQFRIHFVN